MADRRFPGCVNRRLLNNDAVQVWCNASSDWMPGRATQIGTDQVAVEFDVEGVGHCRKLLPMNSPAWKHEADGWDESDPQSSIPNAATGPKLAMYKATMVTSGDPMAITNLTVAEIRDLVTPPADKTQATWIAENTSAVCREIRIVATILSKHCTSRTCSCFSVGQICYSTADAATEIHRIMDNCDQLLASVTPYGTNGPFPGDFKDVARLIYSRIAPIYGHAYLHHFPQLNAERMDQFLNASFQHFVFFGLHYHFLYEAEMPSLGPLIIHFMHKPAPPVDYSCISTGSKTNSGEETPIVISLLR